MCFDHRCVVGAGIGAGVVGGGVMTTNLIDVGEPLTLQLVAYVFTPDPEGWSMYRYTLIDPQGRYYVYQVGALTHHTLQIQLGKWYYTVPEKVLGGYVHQFYPHGGDHA